MAKAVPAVSTKKAKDGGAGAAAGARASPFPAPASVRGKLAKLGLNTDFDLVLHLPLRYEDETRVTSIAEVRHGAPALVEGEILSSDVAYRPRRQLVLKVRDDSGLLFVRFLHFYPSHARSLAVGARVRLFGEVRPGFFGGEMVHPRFRVLRGPEPLADALTPVYPTTAGLPQAVLRQMVHEALDRRIFRRRCRRTCASACASCRSRTRCARCTARRPMPTRARSRGGRTRRGAG